MRKHLKPLVGTMAVLITAAQLPAIAAYADMNDAAPSETIAQESTAAFSVQTEKEVSPQGVLTMGSSFSVSGTVSSDSLIAKAYGGIYTDSGDQVIYYETEPNARSFEIGKTFDTVMAFGKLPAGEYIYKIEAVSSTGETAAVLEHAFTIADNSPIESEIAITGESVIRAITGSAITSTWMYSEKPTVRSGLRSGQMMLPQSICRISA